MNPKTVHEPEEELMSCQEAWQDYLTLKQAEIYEKRKLVELDQATQKLVEVLINKGICKNENEVIARAVRAFFVAVLPSIDEEVLKTFIKTIYASAFI